MDSQELRNLQEAYLEVVMNELDEGAAGDVAARAYKLSLQRKGQTPERKKMYGDLFYKASERERKPSNTDWKRQGLTQKQRDSRREIDVEYSDETGLKNSTPGPGTITKNKRKLAQQKARGQHAESYDIYDIILSHLLDEGYAETPEAAESIMVNMSEEWREDIMEKEDSEYERASDAALDARYGYGRATGPKTSFGRAANRSSAAAALLAIRRGKISGSETSREAGADAVHQGWAHTARTSTDQTPEKKERRAGLANTPYSNLPDDEKEKDRVSFDAVRAVYNRRNQREDFDIYDIVLSHLLDEGYAETPEAAEAIMVNMSEEWRESICENVTSGKSRVRNIQPKPPTGPISNREIEASNKSRIDAEKSRIKKAGDEAHAAAISKGLSFSEAQSRKKAAELRLNREIERSYR